MKPATKLINRRVARAMRRQMQDAQRAGKQSAQQLLNTVLWQIVMQNTGMLRIPCSELRKLPPNIRLEVKRDSASDEIWIIAQQPEDKPNIVVPNDGLIT
ncbi:MAG: hypothetical protein ACYSW8_31535 [Planctomycetota bacterium]|jgi:hypothetical protein